MMNSRPAARLVRIPADIPAAPKTANSKLWTEGVVPPQQLTLPTNNNRWIINSRLKMKIDLSSENVAQRSRNLLIKRRETNIFCFGNFKIEQNTPADVVIH